MRKTNQEIGDLAIVDEIIKKSHICRIAMMDGDQAYVLAFNYGYEENCLYIHSATKGKKLDLLRINPKVGFEIDDSVSLITHESACKWSTTFRSLVGSGELEVISDSSQKIKGLDIIMRHHGASGKLEYGDKHVDAMVILKLTIKELCGKQSGNWKMLYEKSECNFESDRLVFKEMSWDDLDQVHQLHSIPEVDEFNALGLPASIDETKALIKPEIEGKTDFPRKQYNWTIVLKETDQFIGLAGMSLSNDKYRLGEIYYKFNPEFWGKGYATETARKLILMGFERFKLHKVEAGVAAPNHRSIRVLEKVGMTKEGLRRKILPIRGKWLNGFMYAIVDDDPRDY